MKKLLLLLLIFIFCNFLFPSVRRIKDSFTLSLSLSIQFEINLSFVRRCCRYWYANISMCIWQQKVTRVSVNSYTPLRLFLNFASNLSKVVVVRKLDYSILCGHCFLHQLFDFLLNLVLTSHYYILLTRAGKIYSVLN